MALDANKLLKLRSQRGEGQGYQVTKPTAQTTVQAGHKTVDRRKVGMSTAAVVDRTAENRKKARKFYSQQYYTDQERKAYEQYDKQQGEDELKRLTGIQQTANDLKTRIDRESYIAEALTNGPYTGAAPNTADSGDYRAALEQELHALTEEYGGLEGLERTIRELEQMQKRVEKYNSDMSLIRVNDPASEYFDPEFDTLSRADGAVADARYRWINDEQYRSDARGYAGQSAGNSLAAISAGGQERAWAKQNQERAQAWLDANGNPDVSGLDNANLELMTADEVATYNYHYAKGGPEQAQKYLDAITDSLNQRKARQIYAGLEGKTLLELGYGIPVGLDQFAGDVKGMFTNEELPVSATQYASMLVREDLADSGPKLPSWLGGASLAQVGYDAITTTSNMTPSILASAVTNMVAPGAGSWVGLATMSTGAAGGAKQEALRAGYSPTQATTYGLMVGVAEASMEKLLGGISKLGGKGLGGLTDKITGGKFTGFLNNLDNAFLRVSADVGESMLSEGAEEYLQEIIDPILRNAALGEENELALYTPEALYSGLLGAITGGAMEGPSAISGGVGTYKTGKQLQEGGITAQRLSEIGSTFAADTVAYQLAGRVDESTGAYTMGRLLNEIGAGLTEQNVGEITESLVERGVDRKTARKNAETIALVVEGGELTNRQAAAIEADEDLAEALLTAIIDPDATWNRRTKSYKEVLAALTQKKADSESTAEEGSGAAVPEAVGADKSLSEVEEDDGDFAVSESGRAEFDGKPVDIKGIADTKGDMTLALEDGRTVKASEVLYASEGEALVYEAVASLGAPADIGNILVKNYREGAETVEAEDYAVGMVIAFNHGRHNLPKNQMTANPYIAELTDVQRNSAYVLGQRFGGKQVASQQAIARKARFGQRFRQMGQPLTGRVHYDGDVRTLNARQRASVAALEKVANALGVQIHLFESKVDENGVRQGENGWYNTKTGEIGIDIHAGISGEDTMLFTAAHELTHFIKQWSPAKFKVLANFLMKQYGEKGISVEELIERQQAKAKRTGRELSDDEAFEEMVADSMEIMLADGNVVQKLAKLGRQDRTLLEKLRDGIRELVEKIREVYKGLKPDSREGRYVAEMKDSIERMEELFAEALEEAGQNLRAEKGGAATEDSSDVADTDAGNMNAPEFGGGDYDPSRDDEIEFSRRENEKTARMGGKRYSMRDIDIDRTFLDYSDLSAINRAVNEKAQQLIDAGKVVKIDKAHLGKLEEDVDWNNRGVVRSLLKKALETNIGVSVRFEHKGQHAEAYLTRDGIDHSAGGPAGPKKLAAFERMLDLVKNAEYAYSTKNDEHSKKNARTKGKIDWDCFVSVVETDGESYPIVFVLRTIDADTRTQIYELTAKNETGYSRGDGQRKNAPDAHPSYGATPVSGGIVAQDADGVNTKLSARDPAAQRLNQALEQENAAQAEEIKYLRELVRLQGKVTNGTKFTRSSVRSLANQLMKAAGAKGNYLELSELLNGIYEEIAGQDDPLGIGWDSIDGKMQEAAQWLMDHIEVKPDRGEYANDILRDLRGRRISLNEGQMAEVKSRYGSYNDFRKAMFGSFVLSKDGTPLDVAWQELASQYPGTFDAEVGDADMPLELADIVEQLRGTDVAAMEFEMQRDGLLEDLRQKVYDGYWQVSTLYTVADKWQEKVNQLKERHRDTMEKLDKARQERDAANFDRINDVRKLREKKNKAIETIRKNYKDSMKRSVEGRKKTAMRHKIQRVVKELNDLLLKPDKKRHVPEGLRKAVADALAMVNMDTADIEARVARYEALIAAEQAQAKPDQHKIDAYTITMENLQRRGQKIGQQLKELRAAYEEIAKSDDPDTAAAYDENISGSLTELAGTIGDTPLGKMTMEQMSDVYDMFNMMLNYIRDSNKLFNQAFADGATASAGAAVKEINANGRRSRLGIKLVEELKKFGVNNLKPTYFFSYLNSSTFRQLYQGILEGQSTYGRDMDEARSFRLEQWRKFGAKNWDYEKTWTFHASSGERFKLNLEQIMSLYAFSKRDQARDHIREGGIVVDKETDIAEVVESKLGFKVKLKGKAVDATAYAIDDATLDEIIGKLTTKQRGFVDAMQAYLSDVMAAKGNEVSMALYNVKLFKEKHYFPLRSAQEYSVRAREQADQSRRLKNAGFTKGTVPHAKNPIVLSPFRDVWAGHVQDMSSYHGMTLPLEDFYRVYNYGKNGKAGVQSSQSVVATIQNAFGPQATGYIDQLLKDLNGDQIMDSAGSIPEWAMGKFKKGAVFMSASVLFQQSSSVARALAEIDARYISPKAYVESLTVIPRQIGGAFVKGGQMMGMVDKDWGRKHDEVWAELKQYAPIAVIKEMGYFDMNMGKTGKDFLNAEEYDGFMEKLKGMWKDSSYRDEVLSRAPALADELAWCDIWQAVKREQHAKHKGMNIRSEAFLELCGKRFTEIIEQTQVYDSVLSRSANMRSRSGIMRMATSFMAEPTVNSNMLAYAVMEAKRGHGKKAGRVVGSVVAANIINAALASLVYAARDDDEDEEYWEKYLGHLSGEIVDGLNPLTYIPLAQDVVSIFAGWDVERADMAIVSDLADAWNKLRSEEATDWEKTKAVLGATSQLLGLPLKNLLKDGEALYRVLTDVSDEQDSTATGIGYAVRAELPEWIPGGGVVANEDQLYEAIMSGDTAHEQRVRERYKDKDGNIDEGKVTNARRKGLRKNDSRIHEAAVYLNEGQLLEYYAIVEDMVDEGFFSKDDILSAIQTEANALLEDTGEEAATKHKSAFKAEHFAIAAAEGNTELKNKIKADLILTAMDNGKTQAEAEASAVSSIRGAVKEAYVEDGTVSENQAVNSLMGWCDATEKEAQDMVNEWTFEKQNGYALSELEDVFVSGEVSAEDAEGFLVSHGGYARVEAESKVLQWQCEKETGIRYADVQQLYVDGKMTEDRARELRVEYGESSLEDARKTVLQWQCEKDNGVKYSDIDVAYLSGDITEKTAISWLVKYGEKTQEKAELAVQAYRWRDEHTEYKDLSDTAIDRYIDHCVGAGVSIPDFYAANKKVSEIREAGGTTKDNVVQYIRSLPLSRSQKWAVWYAVKTTSWKDNVSF